MSHAEAARKAHTLVEALDYIRTYRGTTVVVKVGGDALDDERIASIVAEDLALLSFVGIRIVIVHGGGPQVTEAMAAADLESRFVGGLRVTDENAMTIAQRVLIGSVNADLVARLCRAGLSAVGLSGIDAGLLSAALARGPGGEDLGRVGAVERVDVSVLETLLAAGHVPVVASVAAGSDGGSLNINADAAAGPIAAALGATKLVYLTNVEGLYADFGDSGSLISELKLDDLEAMAPTLSEGMGPKAASIGHALRSGVGKAHILDGRVEHALLLEVFTDEGIGTQVIP